MQNEIPVAPIILIIFLIVGFLLFIGMIGVFIFLFTIAAKRRRYDTKRGNEMQSAATQIGFSFSPNAELSAIPFFSNFELFEGSPVKFENLMTGNLNGHNAAIFDLVYRNVSGRAGSGATTSRQTMCVIDSNKLNLPEFYLRPEGVLEKVLNAVDQIDIDFYERPDFSKKFLLYGKHAPVLRQLFTAPILDFFEKNPNICAFGNGNFLFVYQSRTLSPAAQIQNWLRLLSFLSNLIRH